MTAEKQPAIHTLFDAIQNFEANPNHVGSVAWTELSAAVATYEATGDHDHGTGSRTRSIAPGDPCPGGDCLVFRARKLLFQSLSRSLGLLPL